VKALRARTYDFLFLLTEINWICNLKLRVFSNLLRFKWQLLSFIVFYKFLFSLDLTVVLQITKFVIIQNRLHFAVSDCKYCCVNHCGHFFQCTIINIHTSRYTNSVFHCNLHAKRWMINDVYPFNIKDWTFFCSHALSQRAVLFFNFCFRWLPFCCNIKASVNLTDLFILFFYSSVFSDNRRMWQGSNRAAIYMGE